MPSMPGPVNTLLIDGSFEELVEELARYIDDLRKKQGSSSTLWDEIAPLLAQNARDDALKKLVTASVALNSAPEKEFIAAYNLLVHIVRHSPQYNTFLPRICQNLSGAIPSSPTHAGGLALSILSTIFNTLPEDSETRYHVFMAILRVARSQPMFDVVRPQLKSVDAWLKLWETDEEDQRKLYLLVSDLARDAGDDEFAYTYLLKALRSIPSAEAGNGPARELAIRALKSALGNADHYDFQDLTALDSIQSLRRSDAVLFELLEIFSAEQLDEYKDFLEEHTGFVEQQDLNADVLQRKMRLLTLASLAASTPSRSLPYQHISRALQVPEDEVEMWVIDVIRAGLVEGKLSQLSQTFLIHRSTYRVFGEKQWSEVSGRLDTWRTSLEGVLSVVRAEREKMIRDKEREVKELDNKYHS